MHLFIFWYRLSSWRRIGASGVRGVEGEGPALQV